MSGREYPARPLVGIGIIVLRADAVLLVRRGRPPPEGKWSLPGGAQKFGETAEAAARLFAGLRWLDAEGARLGLRGIAAMPVPERGLGLAVNDRLQRAAAPRN